MKKLIVMLSIIAVLLSAVGMVGAQDATPTPVPATSTVGAGVFPNKLDRTALRRASERILLQATADATKLSREDILKQLTTGKTLADVITANGATVETVVNAAVATATDQITTAVKAGRLGQVQADALIANLQKAYTAAVNGEFRLLAEKAIITVAVLRLAAEQTGMTVKDIVGEIRSGKSLADVLKEHGVDVTAFMTSAVDAAKKRLDQAVTNGRITQDNADKRLQQFQQRLTERINKVGGVESTPEATAAA
ncbi:MAG: hypothetical protein GC179_29645 [Anaerolineaceae bacterium]|nr:hypothetical protein [Anaerolineaceae bacterium]